MADEPTLPQLPRPNGPLLRTRQRLEGKRRAHDLPTSSSDPAFFSSDDDPALDNYNHEESIRRRKRRYIGSWFDQHPASSDSAVSEIARSPPKKQPRQLRRQLDSGVWMSADPADDTDDAGFDLEPAKSRLPTGLARHTSLPMSLQSAPSRPVQPASWPALSEQEQLLHQRLSKAIDEGEERIDFSGYNLTHLSNETIASLSELTTFPTVTKDVPFKNQEPQLKLFLSTNLLTRAPRAVFSIQNLTVLTLRHNRLKELPGCVNQLKNLTTLNVAENRLKYLPSELLDLMRYGSRLSSFQFYPNPYYRPVLPFHEWGASEYESLTFNRVEPKWDTPWTGFSTKLCGRSPVQLTTSLGRVLSEFDLSSAVDHLTDRLPHENFWDLSLSKDLAASDLGQQSRVPTLFELALSKASGAATAEELSDKLSEVPEHIRDCAREAVGIAESGGYQCSVCGRKMITPRLRWLEWRTVFTQNVDKHEGKFIEQNHANHSHGKDIHVPFIRMGCSWKCLPVRSPEPPAEPVASDSQAPNVSQEA